jgi:hypothetical protein
LLAAKVATMLGRKMEEDDWDFVFCGSKGIPMSDWSNLHIDVNHDGLGVEQKMLRITKSGSLLQQCGTTHMHPAGTRSIRIPDTEDPQLAMESILQQYNELIEIRKQSVIESSSAGKADMRIGWLLWKDTLDEFLYFQEPMEMVDPAKFQAQWNETPARGARKPSRSLWIYDIESAKKRYSVTTTAGAKIQPYFDVPPPTDPGLYHFRVQGVQLDGGLVGVWLTKSTAKYLELLLGSLSPDTVSHAIEQWHPDQSVPKAATIANPLDLAVPIQISQVAYAKLKNFYDNQPDEIVFQQFAMAVGETDSQ